MVAGGAPEWGKGKAAVPRTTAPLQQREGQEMLQSRGGIESWVFTKSGL